MMMSNNNDGGGDAKVEDVEIVMLMAGMIVFSRMILT